MGKSVDLAKLEAVYVAVNNFSKNVSDYSSEMQQILNECHENLGRDTVTKQARSELSACIKQIKAAIKDADSLSKKINKKIADLKDKGKLGGKG